jgi:hypothetical protein
MPAYTISIKLEAASNTDYEKLSSELEEKSFQSLKMPVQRSAEVGLSPFICKSGNVSSLLDLSSVVSEAAAHTGKKFVFTIIKDKMKAEMGHHS